MVYQIVYDLLIILFSPIALLFAASFIGLICVWLRKHGIIGFVIAFLILGYYYIITRVIAKYIGDDSGIIWLEGIIFLCLLPVIDLLANRYVEYKNKHRDEEKDNWLGHVP